MKLIKRPPLCTASWCCYAGDDVCSAACAGHKLPLKAVHCSQCGILTGYSESGDDILCVLCGQKILSKGI